MKRTKKEQRKSPVLH